MRSINGFIALGIGCLLSTAAYAGNQGTTIEVTKTAATDRTRTDTYTWDVTKTLKPNQTKYIIREGSTYPVEFLISATRSGPTIAYANTPVVGQVCITNTGTKPTVGLWVMDELQQSTDGGMNWTTINSTLITSTELAAGANQCFPYSFPNQLNPLYMYRNVATATIDNYFGFEGTAHDVVYTVAVAINDIVTNVDMTANLSDLVTCPAGFTCAQPWTTMPLSDSLAETVYTIDVTNVSHACGDTVPLVNRLTLTPSDTAAIWAEATAQIYTGTCHP